MGGKGVGKRMCLFFFFWLHRVFVAACGILYPKQESNPGPLLGAQSLSHWTTREVPETVAF